MTTDTAIEDLGLLLGEGWRDRIEAGVRGRIRGFIEEMLEAELLQALGRERSCAPAQDHIGRGCGKVRRAWR